MSGLSPAVAHLGHGANLLLHQVAGAANLRLQQLGPHQVVELLELPAPPLPPRSKSSVPCSCCNTSKAWPISRRALFDFALLHRRPGPAHVLDGRVVKKDHQLQRRGSANRALLVSLPCIRLWSSFVSLAAACWSCAGQAAQLRSHLLHLHRILLQQRIQVAVLRGQLLLHRRHAHFKVVDLVGQGPGWSDSGR